MPEASSTDDKAETAPPPPTSSSNNEPPKSDNDVDNNNSNKEPIDYNPRWMGYCYIILASLVNFCAVSNVPGEQRHAFWFLSLTFGVMSFIVASLIMIQNWSQPYQGVLPNVTKIQDGYLEGYVLLALVLWWVVGVAYITRPGGIAYVASNIWYSAWLSLISCVYTLNEWSDSKDVLSIEEITSISPTLKFWWLLFLAATIVFGSCMDIIIRFNQPWNDFDDASFGLALGLSSMAISFVMILIHYDFLSACQCEEGGWAELFTSFFLILVWIIGLSILTREGGIAATMSGNQCFRYPGKMVPMELNCTVVVDDLVIPCDQIPMPIPGSNLYFACWCCMLSSMAIAFEWKAAQALKFAQAQAERQQQKEQDEQQFGSDYGDDDDDDEEEDDT